MNDRLIMKTPASWHRDLYREGAPTGNGKIGALVYGGITHETVVVNHSSLWSLGKVQDLPDIHETLAETREKIDQGDFWNANWISSNALKEKGYKPRLGAPCSLCDIRLEMKDLKPFKKYRRIVEMDSGEVVVKWQEEETFYNRKLFVSRSRDLIFYEITSNNRKINLDLWLDFHETYEDDGKSKKEALQKTMKSYSWQDGIGFYAQHEDETWYGAIGAVITDGNRQTLVEGRLNITEATKILFVLKPFVKENEAYAKKPQVIFEEEVFSYEKMKTEHQKIHSALYQSVDLKLTQPHNFTNEELLAEAYEEHASLELLERQWKFGRYLMICGTGEDGLPFPLYGLWHGRYKMPWPHNMANENVEMIYWHTLAGGLTFAVKSLIKYYLERLSEFRECAHKVFGLPGIYMPAGTTPGNCKPNQIVPVIMNWIGCAGWMAQHLYDYYLYTGDEKTLKEEILPFMLEAATFYEAYLVKEENGKYKIYPSVSPENTPGNLIPEEQPDMAHPCPSVINATMDVAIIKELISHLLEVSYGMNLYVEKREIWKDIIENLPQYEMTKEGDIKEWIYPDLDQRYNHRHLSHIYPVFPGREVVKERDNEVLLEAFENAVDKRILGAQTGWSLAHMSCIYSRFQKPEKAIECLDILSKSCLLNNLFTLHNDWRGMGLTLGRGNFAPVQLDAAMGCVAAIQEMLLYAGEDFVKLLPSLPKRLIRGEVLGLRFMTGTVSMNWDREQGLFEATLKAERLTHIHLFLPEYKREAKFEIRSEQSKVEGLLRNGEEITLQKGEVLYLK